MAAIDRSDPSKKPAHWKQQEGAQFIEFIAETLNVLPQYIWDADPHTAMRALDDDEKGRQILPTPSGNPKRGG